MDRPRNPERGAGRRPMPQLHTVPLRTNHLCRTYQVPLTLIVARPSGNEWIFTRFLDCPTSQYCNRLQTPMNSPSRPDRDNRVGFVSMPGTAYRAPYTPWRTRLYVTHMRDGANVVHTVHKQSQITHTDPWELYDTSPNHRNSCVLGLGFQLAITPRRKASKTVNHQPPVQA